MKKTDTSRTTSAQLTERIDFLEKTNLVFTQEEASQEDIKELESSFNIFLPEDFRFFLRKHNGLTSESVTILPCSSLNPKVPRLFDFMLAFRLSAGELHEALLPIEVIEKDRYACLVCDLTSPKGHSKVVLFDAALSQALGELEELASSFNDYLLDKLNRIQIPIEENAADFEKAWDCFEEHVLDYQRKFNYDHATGGKLPRSTDYRPYRYCIQDVVFGVTVVRYNQTFNSLEVDVFLTADIPEYGPLAGTKALVSFLLSEAYKCGSSMEIHFTKNVEGGNIPHEIVELAKKYGIEFTGQPNQINARDAKRLFSAITGFSCSLSTVLERLEIEGLLSVPRACYVVNNGIWSANQLELIVLGSEDPESILAGQVTPDNRHKYYHAILHARSALLAGMFERVICKRERSMDGVSFELEDDFRLITTTFDSKYYCNTFCSNEEIKLPWLSEEIEEHFISENNEFNVLIRARRKSDMLRHFMEDLSAAGKLKKESQRPVFILVTSDFFDLSPEYKNLYKTKANEYGIGILVCPESASILDNDAAKRLSSSRVIRQ